MAKIKKQNQGFNALMNKIKKNQSTVIDIMSIETKSPKKVSEMIELLMAVGWIEDINYTYKIIDNG